MSDMTSVIVPKSEQLNSDDLITGPRTITIRDVTIKAGEQPCSMFYDGDNGKPYKPCKSMARVLVAAWGADAAKYVGRSLTLYRDAKVKWAGMEVGGIRISHMSHIERDMVMALTETKGKRAPFKVMPMKESARKADASSAGDATATGQSAKAPPQSATIGFATADGEIKDYPRNLSGLEAYVGDFEKAFHDATDKAAWFADNEKMFHELAVGATGSRAKSERCEKLAARFDAVANMIGEALGAGAAETKAPPKEDDLAN